MSREVIFNVIRDQQETFMKLNIVGLESDSHRRKRRLVKKITRQAKREYDKDRANNIKHTGETFFKDIRGKEKVKRSLGPLRNMDEQGFF